MSANVKQCTNFANETISLSDEHSFVVALSDLVAPGLRILQDFA
jgi:hypothetical protein